MTTAELIRHLRLAAAEADARGCTTMAANLRKAALDVIEEARLEEDARMIAHLRAHTNAGHTVETEENRATIIDALKPWEKPE